MRIAEDNGAQGSLFAAIHRVEFLIHEQAWTAMCLFTAFILVGFALNSFGGSFLALDTVVVLVVGAPLAVYAILCAAMKNEKLWAAITLLALISLHMLFYLTLVVAVLLQISFSGVAIALILAGIFIVPMLMAIVSLVSLLRNFNRLPSHQPPAFQVVLPIDNSREK